MAKTPSSGDGQHVVVGQFAGPHGVRGAFKVRSFTDIPEDVASYGPLTTEDGRVLTLSLEREVKPGLFLAHAPEIKTPEDCADFKGALLHVSRAVLPPPQEDEFYLTDLEGLCAVTPDGQDAGKVRAMVNYGAGDILELMSVPGRKGAVLVPFTREDVPDIDLQTGRVTVVLPAEDD